jgi:transcriptional regulator with XRE-family HTH domain
MGFGNTLQKLRQAAGISQAELARQSDTPLDTLRKWEQGRTLPNIEAAARLAKALGVSLDRLAAYEGAARPAGAGEGTPKKPRGRVRKK